MKVTLQALGGELTVGRRTSGFVWGKWDVAVPNEVAFEDPDPTMGEGFIYRPDGLSLGRFDLVGSRADVSQTMAVTPEGELDYARGRSNTEQVLEAAESRVDGDVFFERDIPMAGLGKFEPGKHFDIGDVVDVRIWGKTIRSLVTSIDRICKRGDAERWRVHVGGQPISDAKALQSHVDKIWGDIEAERRKAIQETGKASAAATAAKTSASVAAEVAGAAKTVAEKALELAGNVSGSVAEELAEARKNLHDSAEHLAQVARHAENVAALKISVDNLVAEASTQASNADRARQAADSSRAEAESEARKARQSEQAALVAKNATVADLALVIQHMQTAQSHALTAGEARDRTLQLHDAAIKSNNAAIRTNTDAISKLNQSTELLSKATVEQRKATEASNKAVAAQGEAIKSAASAAANAGNAAQSAQQAADRANAVNAQQDQLLRHLKWQRVRLDFWDIKNKNPNNDLGEPFGTCRKVDTKHWVVGMHGQNWRGLSLILANMTNGALDVYVAGANGVRKDHNVRAGGTTAIRSLTIAYFPFEINSKFEPDVQPKYEIHGRDNF